MCAMRWKSRRAARPRARSTSPAACWSSRPDPDSPAHDKSLDRSKPVILYCASGGRSALAGKTLKDLGYEKVYNLGAFKDWAESGGEIDKA